MNVQSITFKTLEKKTFNFPENRGESVCNSFIEKKVKYLIKDIKTKYENTVLLLSCQVQT